MTFYDHDYTNISSEEIFDGVIISKADGKRCIVCGEPAGNCTSKDYDGPGHVVTLGKDEELAEIDMYTVEEDIWEERPISKNSTSRFLVARKGRQISRQKAQELGII